MTQIEVLLVDDRHAASYSLWALLNWQRNLHVIATVATSAEAVALTKRRSPHVCLVSAALGPAGALRVVDRLKQLDDPPRVLLYADAVDTQLAAAASLAGADGVLRRYADPAHLADAIKDVVAGRQRFPGLESDALPRLADLVSGPDRPIASMLLLHTPHDEIARALGISGRSLTARRQGILRQLDEAIARPRGAARHGQDATTRRSRRLPKLATPDQGVSTP